MVRSFSLLLVLLLSLPVIGLDEVDFRRDSIGEMDDWQRYHWNESIKNLRRYAKPNKDVIVIFEDLVQGEFGRTTNMGGSKSYIIRIDPKTTYFMKVNTLIHEWAHCISWSDDTHGSEWGKAYARCYRTVMLQEDPDAPKKKEDKLHKP